jgi:SAM-dependent methyltransferase
MSIKKNIPNCIFCTSPSFEKLFEYNEPPLLETRFNSLKLNNYYREVVICENCSHMYSVHEMDLGQLYLSEYNQSTYQNLEGMEKTFKRITTLEPSQSDNWNRCERVDNFISSRFPGKERAEVSVLDIGSGLGVFPFEMKKKGYDVTALDPDSIAIEHIKKHSGVTTILGDFLEVKIEEKYDVISLNKVLEHIENPILMLEKVNSLLKESGIVYIEIPDGEIAKGQGKEREEFLIEHHHAFSFSSFSLLIDKAGFHASEIKRIIDPSKKFTLYGFLQRL